MSDDTKFLHARFKDEDGNSIFNMRVTSVPDPGTTIFLTDWHGRRAEYWVLSVTENPTMPFTM